MIQNSQYVVLQILNLTKKGAIFFVHEKQMKSDQLLGKAPLNHNNYRLNNTFCHLSINIYNVNFGGSTVLDFLSTV